MPSDRWRGRRALLKLEHESLALLLQLVIILGTARLLGLVLRYFGQPAVIGEMAAGLLLGPVVFGAIAPELHAEIFAPGSRGALEGLSQLGLVLFMFIVGAELRLPTGVRSQLVALDLDRRVVGDAAAGAGLRDRVPAVPVVSHPGRRRSWPFALFTAVAVSITAFPVMARILKDRNMTQTTVGRLGADVGCGGGRARVGSCSRWSSCSRAARRTGTLLVRQIVGVLLLRAVIFGVFRPLDRVAAVDATRAMAGLPAHCSPRC